MEMRKTEKDIMINGRKFRIKKFSALLGTGILRDLLTTALPINITDFLPGASALKGATSKAMSIQEFEDFQKLLLSKTFEMLPAGETPIINANGDFGVIDLEYDTLAVLSLLKDIIMFNFESLFTEGLSLFGITKPMESDGK
ncbi:MAG: hypothetical protein WCN92_11360 [Eubacteriales bacterium]